MFTPEYLTSLHQRMLMLDKTAYREFADLVAVLAWERVKAHGFEGSEASQFAKDCSWRLAARIRDLSNASAIALEEWLSAELDAALRDWLVEFARDVLEARVVQCDLMPNRQLTSGGLEIASHSRPMRVLTGDLHDVFELPGDRVLMALGDASGHGAAAGLYSCIGLSLLRMALTKVQEPAAILRSLNQAMGGWRAGERYITLTLVLWERRRSQFRVANAGGKVVRIVRAGLSTPVEIPGQWLGWFPKADYEEITVPAEVGDVVMMASDGVPDQENSGGNQYEDDAFNRFLESSSGLSAGEIAKGVLLDVERFAEGKPQEDDQTVVVAKVL